MWMQLDVHYPWKILSKTKYTPYMAITMHTSCSNEPWPAAKSAQEWPEEHDKKLKSGPWWPQSWSDFSFLSHSSGHSWAIDWTWLLNHWGIDIVFLEVSCDGGGGSCGFWTRAFMDQTCSSGSHRCLIKLGSGKFEDQLDTLCPLSLSSSCGSPRYWSCCLFFSSWRMQF